MELVQCPKCNSKKIQIKCIYVMRSVHQQNPDGSILEIVNDPFPQDDVDYNYFICCDCGKYFDYLNIESE
jgi:hypothetical protein